MFLFVVVITACKAKKVAGSHYAGTVQDENITIRNDIRRWIEDKGCKSMIVYERSNDDNFIEIEKIGDPASIAKLRRYAIPKSFEIYKDDKRVEGVIAMLAYQESSEEVSINTYFCSVVSGQVSLFSGADELVVSSSTLLDVMRSTHSQVNCTTPNNYKHPKKEKVVDGDARR